MDLRTTYLGLTLSHPVVPGASPLADDLDIVKRLEDAGAPAIVLRSLFEEQIVREQMAEHFHLDGASESFAEAMSMAERRSPTVNCSPAGNRTELSAASMPTGTRTTSESSWCSTMSIAVMSFVRLAMGRGTSYWRP